VRAKTENPTWVIPESIRREHIRERDDPRRSIAGGDPENPLGRYRLALSKAPYAIHGTNIAWGPGMAITHGCMRLYPEDIERLYPFVPVGTRVEIVDQPVKIGWRGQQAYVEAAPDAMGGIDPRPRVGVEATRRVDAQRCAPRRRSRGLPVASPVQ
jgi:L,D-transpeptidase ErfK/SrfK